MSSEKKPKRMGPPRLCVKKSSLDRLIDRELRMELHQIYESLGAKPKSVGHKKSISWRPFRNYGLEGAIRAVRHPAWNGVPPIPVPAVPTELPRAAPPGMMPLPILRHLRNYSCLPKPNEYLQISPAQWQAFVQTAIEFTEFIEITMALICMSLGLFILLSIIF